MKPFKFLEIPKTYENRYLMFNMDDALINVLRWKKYHNMEALNNDTYLHDVNVPINGYLRILDWRTSTNVIPEIIELDYRVIELNTTPINFTCRMEVSEFIRRIDISGIS
jgi:hypothetical protein